LVTLIAAGFVILSPNHSPDSKVATIQSNHVSTPGTAGMKAYLDPETGELVVGVSPLGDIELDADTENALRRDDEGLKIGHHADGSISVNLEGRYQSVSVVRIDENGKAVICSDNAAGVEKVLSGNVSHPAAPEVK
jgi:hypothetical protein